MDHVDPVDREFVIDTIRDLVRINSVNPDLVPGAPGESAVAAFVCDVLGSCGIDPIVVEPRPGRPSVVGTLPGRGGGRSLMLNAHYDTVGVDGMSQPFSGHLQDGRVYGRGAYDMKGALAGCLGALDALGRNGIRLDGDVVLAAVADEEYASIGMASVLEHVRTDGAVVTEPTHLRVCRAHKGFIWYRVEVPGKAAHGSRFELGIDANVRMGHVLVALGELEQALRVGPAHPLVGPPSMHLPLLRGGTGISTYADRSVVEIERRTVPGETVDGVTARIREVLDRVGREHGFGATLEVTLVREPFEINDSADVVGAVDRALEAVTGEPASHVGDTPWMDAALLAAAGVETVVLGPTGAGAHATEEWVDVDSVITLSRVLVATAIDYCTGS